MNDREYARTQNILLAICMMTKELDLKTFRKRIEDSLSIGATTDPTLFMSASRLLQGIDGMAKAGENLQASFDSFQHLASEKNKGGGE